jgi:SdrD B-like domain
MRLLAAAMVGVLSSMVALAAPTLTISMAATQSNQGEILATVTVGGGTPGVLEFRRYSNTSCTTGVSLVGSVTIAGSGTFTGPNLQTGNIGGYGLRVRFVGSRTVNSNCFAYLVQRTVTVTAALPKPVYDNNDRMEPAIELANTTADAGGQVEIGRWAGPGCPAGKAVSTGILPVVAGKPQGTVNLQDGLMGVRSFRATYSGDTKNSTATSVCKDYTIGFYIRGKVFQDNDGSGTIDPGEEGIADAIVTVRKGQSVVGAPTTDPQGAYEVLVTSTGTYTVSLTPPKGYDSTGPAELTVQITGSAVNDRDFGVAQVPSTLLPMPTLTAGDDLPAAIPPEASSTSDAGFAVLRMVALGLLVLAAATLAVLILGSRNRHDAA